MLLLPLNVHCKTYIYLSNTDSVESIHIHTAIQTVRVFNHYFQRYNINSLKKKHVLAKLCYFIKHENCTNFKQYDV